MDADQSDVDRKLMEKHLASVASSSIQTPMPSEPKPRSDLVAFKTQPVEPMVAFKPSSSLQKFMMMAKPVDSEDVKP